jgi:hypothetical protein
LVWRAHGDKQNFFSKDEKEQEQEEEGGFQ